MSTRTVTVKTNNKQQHHNNNNNTFSNNNQSNTISTVSIVSKSNKNTIQQQPKKKLQATNKKNGGRKNQQSKKVAAVTKLVVLEDDTSSSSSSSSEDEKTINHNVKKRNSHYKQQFEYKSFVDQVYAGPTFNNAPAPSALPIPAFNARGSPINYPQPLYYQSTTSLQQQSLDLLNLITPQKVITAFELEKTNLALSEIQRGLRSMLKIES